MNINHLTIGGNLTADPEVRFTPTGKQTASLRIANNTKTSKDTTETTYLDAVCWEKTAEVAAQYLKKGSPVVLEGRLKLEEWEAKNNGGRRSKHVLTVTRLHLFPSVKPGELSQPDAGEGGDIPLDGQLPPPHNPFG